MTIATLQAGLVRAGRDPGPVDGVFGVRTLAACCDMLAPGSVSIDLAGTMWAAMRGQDITTPLRIINFLANVGAESKFRIIAENLNYTAPRLVKVWPQRFPSLSAAMPYAMRPQALAERVYGGRMGNTQPGDGYRYRGRGWAQLTGRDAYRQVGDIIGLPLEADPDLILSGPACALSAAGFWTWKRLELYADLDDSANLRRAWNGGLNGWEDVRAAVTSLKGLWGV